MGMSPETQRLYDLRRIEDDEFRQYQQYAERQRFMPPLWYYTPGNVGPIKGHSGPIAKLFGLAIVLFPVAFVVYFALVGAGVTFP